MNGMKTDASDYILETLTSVSFSYRSSWPHGRFMQIPAKSIMSIKKKRRIMWNVILRRAKIVVEFEMWTFVHIIFSSNRVAIFVVCSRRRPKYVTKPPERNQVIFALTLSCEWAYNTRLDTITASAAGPVSALGAIAGSSWPARREVMLLYLAVGILLGWSWNAFCSELIWIQCLAMIICDDQTFEILCMLQYDADSTSNESKSTIDNNVITHE
jgi:hypothetical protein